MELKDGEYELGDRIDKGGFGEVFLGTRIASQYKKTQVAIKKCKVLTVDDKRGTPDPRLEAKILKELSKVNDAKHVIVEYFDSFIEGDYHYLVMEYCQHKSIYTYLLKERNCPLPENQAIDVLINVLAALDIIHQAGYVHRDLSPKNILIHSFSDDSVPQIKIVDFGLSKKMHLIKNTVVGTPGFFDPKMMRKGYSKDVDFYALGCVAFFILTNQLMLIRDNKHSKENKLSPADIEVKMKALSLSQDAIDLVLMLTSTENGRIDSSTQIRLCSFFTKDIINGAYVQASSIRNILKKIFWPLAQTEFNNIVKNVMVNNFGRAIIRGPEKLLICEKVNFNDKCKCTYVGRLVNISEMNQELRLYKPTKTYYLQDFLTHPHGIPESELGYPTFVVKRPNQMENNARGKAARAMYLRMQSILKTVGEMERKRERNPNLIVDTLAKITWNGMISVELPDKQVVTWHYTSQRPPVEDYPHLTQDIIQMLESVHIDFGRLYLKS